MYPLEEEVRHFSNIAPKLGIIENCIYKNLNFCWLWYRSTINQGPGDPMSRYRRTSIMVPEYLIKVVENNNEGPGELIQGP
jgi:hypothetical protein